MVGIAWSSDFSIGNISAVVGIVAAFGGSIVALFYGRKANATVTATAQRLENRTILLAVRPVVAGAGLFKIKFKRGSQQLVQVTEVKVEQQGLASIIRAAPERAVRASA